MYIIPLKRSHSILLKPRNFFKMVTPISCSKPVTHEQEPYFFFFKNHKKYKLVMLLYQDLKHREVYNVFSKILFSIKTLFSGVQLLKQHAISYKIQVNLMLKLTPKVLVLNINFGLDCLKSPSLCSILMINQITCRMLNHFSKQIYVK